MKLVYEDKSIYYRKYLVNNKAIMGVLNGNFYDYVYTFKIDMGYHGVHIELKNLKLT